MMARTSQQQAGDSAQLVRQLTDAERVTSDVNTCLTFYVFISGDVTLRVLSRTVNVETHTFDVEGGEETKFESGI